MSLFTLFYPALIGAALGLLVGPFITPLVTLSFWEGVKRVLTYMVVCAFVFEILVLIYLNVKCLFS